MQRVFVILMVGLMMVSCSGIEKESELKSLLVKQIQNSHNNQDWFVPTKTAIEGLNYDQAAWKDSTANHSIIEIVSHLIFWNERVLKAFKAEQIPDFDNDNEKTFIEDHSLDWNAAVFKLDSIQTEWMRAVENAPDDQIKAWTMEISNMTAHAAYHTGQIIYIRKRNGWWE